MASRPSCGQGTVRQRRQRCADVLGARTTNGTVKAPHSGTYTMLPSFMRYATPAFMPWPSPICPDDW